MFAAARDHNFTRVGDHQADDFAIGAFYEEARLRTQTVHLFQVADEFPRRLWAVPPGHHLGAGFGRGAAIVLGLESVHFGARIGLQLLELTSVLLGLTLLFGGLMIEALLLDGHARLMHAETLRGIDGGLFAFLPGLGGFGVIVICEVTIGEGLPVGWLARVALGGGLPMREAFA